MTYKYIKDFYALVMTYDKSDSKDESMSQMRDLVNKFDMEKLTLRGVAKLPEFTLKALKEENYTKANKCVNKLLSKSFPVANDNPVNIGKDVYLIRSEHGWYNGERKAKVVDRQQRKSGVWSYKVKMYDGSVLSDYNEDVGHTRDMLVVD